MEVDPFAAGEYARKAGKPSAANPHDSSAEPAAHLAWADGWGAVDQGAGWVRPLRFFAATTTVSTLDDAWNAVGDAVDAEIRKSDRGAGHRRPE